MIKEEDSKYCYNYKRPTNANKKSVVFQATITLLKSVPGFSTYSSTMEPAAMSLSLSAVLVVAMYFDLIMSTSQNMKSLQY